MTYQVLLLARAERDLDEVTDWIARNAPQTAGRWFDGFVAALASLRENPRRCGLARENDAFPFELRRLLYGRHRNYRALFTIRGDQVLVLAIRHAAQDDISPDDL